MLMRIGFCFENRWKVREFPPAMMVADAASLWLSRPML